MREPRTLESIARERFTASNTLEVGVRRHDAPYGTKPIHFITGYRPEDDDGGCMASGTNSMVYGYTLQDDGTKSQWLHKPEDSSEDGWVWVWTRYKLKENVKHARFLGGDHLTSGPIPDVEHDASQCEMCQPQPSVPPIGRTLALRPDSIDGHTIQKLEGDVRFWKLMFMGACILGFIVGLTGCTPGTSFTTACLSTQNAAFESADEMAALYCTMDATAETVRFSTMVEGLDRCVRTKTGTIGWMLKFSAFCK